MPADQRRGVRSKARASAVLAVLAVLAGLSGLAGCERAAEDAAAVASLSVPSGRVPALTAAALPVAAMPGSSLPPAPASAAAASAVASADIKSLANLAPDKHGELVRQGHAIFTNTPVFARRYSGNRLSCTNCHLDAGRRADASPMWGAFGMYPAYVAKADRVITLEERIQQCFRFSLNGLPPPLDSQEVRALVSYAQWLSVGHVVGVQQPGRGFPTVARTGADPNAFSGKALYATRCAACHGRQGEGFGPSDSGSSGAANGTVPPLWGRDSFNKGAGMNRIDLMAGFLKANMPLGNPDLTDQQALDIAAWIALQERWPDPRKGLVTGWLER